MSSYVYILQPCIRLVSRFRCSCQETANPLFPLAMTKCHLLFGSATLTLQIRAQMHFPPFSSGYSVFHVLIFQNNFFFNNKERKWDSSKLGLAIIHRKFNKIDFRKGERLKISLFNEKCMGKPYIHCSVSCYINTVKKTTKTNHKT